MITLFGSCFKLDTNTSSYIFKVLPSGHLEHLYYGKYIKANSEKEILALTQKNAFPIGNSIVYSDTSYSLENMCLEVSTFGKGDLREPFIKVDLETTDFVFDFAKVKKREELKTLPSSYGSCESLYVRLIDKNLNLTLETYYNVFENIITKTTKLINTSSKDIQLTRLMSLQLDFNEDDLCFTTFNGSWTNEMHRHIHKPSVSKIVNSSLSGTTSSRANSFVMISKEDTTEDFGDAYGFHLLYSGNHKEVFEVSPYHQTRLLTGINDDTFNKILKVNEEFEVPEAIMAYSNKGYNDLSFILHNFIRKHIINKNFAYKTRPILLNSWEAYYFNINEKKLLQLAKKAKDVGIELFVVDDGWFGKRNDDTSSLGDWYVNKDKFPHGLDYLCNKINNMGLDFGIWVEPEMVNVNSELYKKHPSWCIDNINHAEGRNQRLLDLTRDDVVSHIIDQMSILLSSCNIKYVKWDMNRIFSDYHSNITKSGEIAHQYVIGLYKILNTLTKKFPHILFEGCAAGGNRFDLGILSYFPQIWPSDNTDSMYRFEAMKNYSYGYPINSFTSHVSASINHQTLRKLPMFTRFNASCLGILGYEININDLNNKELEEIKNDISFYKKYREVLQLGNIYRDKNSFTIVYKDNAIGIIYQTLANNEKNILKFKAKGLNEDTIYHFTNRNYTYDISNFGDLINTASPIHIKPNSLKANILSHFVSLSGEKEDYIVSGSLLMNAGITLKQNYQATGYNEEIRYYPDFSSRLYIIEKHLD